MALTRPGTRARLGVGTADAPLASASGSFVLPANSSFTFCISFATNPFPCVFWSPGSENPFRGSENPSLGRVNPPLVRVNPRVCTKRRVAISEFANTFWVWPRTLARWSRMLICRRVYFLHAFSRAFPCAKLLRAFRGDYSRAIKNARETVAPGASMKNLWLV